MKNTANQQHFFLSLSFFFWLSFLVGTSTGIKLRISRNLTSILAYSQLKPMQFSRKSLRFLPGSLHSCSDARFWGAFEGISSRLPRSLHARTLYRFYCRREWRGIFKATWAPLGSWIHWSRIRCYRKTRLNRVVLSCLWCHRPTHSSQLPCKKPLPDSWTFPDRQCPRSEIMVWILPGWWPFHPQ